MKYLAEYLDNLERVALSIETETSRKCVIKSGSPETLELIEHRKSSRIIQLPAATETLHPTEFSEFPKPLKLKLKAKLRLSLSKKPDTNRGFDPPRCGDGALLAPDVKWKQLPSEHWTELMDLWHCHKPSKPCDEGTGLYSLALNGFHPQKGLAYYSETYYLVHADDIRKNPHSLDCNLRPNLEHTSSPAEIKIWKWDLTRDNCVGPVFSRILAELTDAHAVFTFSVNSKLSIWVLKTDTMWTSTGCTGPLRGMKVLYGSLEKSETRPNAEELTVPEEALERLTEELEMVNRQLPNYLHKMNGWRLSFLSDYAL